MSDGVLCTWNVWTGHSGMMGRVCVMDLTVYFALCDCCSGLVPLALVGLILLLGVVWVVGSHLVRRKPGPLPVKGGLLAGLPAALVIVYCAVPTVAYTSFSAFNCRTYMSDSAAGTSTAFLLGDPSVRCWDGDAHADIMRSAIALIICWPIGGTLLVALLLYASQTAIVERTPTDLSRATAFLHREFKPAFALWEGIC